MKKKVQLNPEVALLLDRFFAENAVAESTRETYQFVLARFLVACQPESCTAREADQFITANRWGKSLAYTASIAIKKYLRWKYGADHPALLLRRKRGKSKPGRAVTAQQAGQLLESFRLETVKGKRDYAICCLALDTGMRVKELANIRMADIDLAARKALFAIKGGEWRHGVFSELTRAAVADWCNYRRPGDERLFQVTRDGLRVIVRRWGEKCGFRLSPHDLRRGFATLSTQNDAPSRMVQLAGRWSSIEMVERYTQNLVLTAEGYDDFFPVRSILE